MIRGEKGNYELFLHQKKIGDFQVPFPGRHNALNATASIVASLAAGISFETCRNGIMKFNGVDRRFQLKGEAAGISVYDDYGHHPTEVRATLQAFREKFPDRRLVVYFQPHRFSRTQICWNEFTTCFSQCDDLIVTDIYPAGEKPIEGISSEKLVSEIKHSSVRFLVRSSENISGQLKAGDVFLTLGAGDGWKVGMETLSALQSRGI